LGPLLAAHPRPQRPFAVTRRYSPLLAVTRRYSPLLAVTRRYSPLIHARNGPAFASTFPGEGSGAVETAAANGVADATPDEVFIAVVGFGSRTNSSQTTAWMKLDSKFGQDGYRLFDCYRGVELPIPRPGSKSSAAGWINVSFVMEAMESRIGAFGASGFGGLLLTKNGSDPTLQTFLRQMKALTQRPLGDFSCEGGPQCADGPAAWPFYTSCNVTHCAGLLQSMAEITPTQRYSAPPPVLVHDAPTSTARVGGLQQMVSVPGGTFKFVSSGVEWRGNTAHSKRGVGFQFPWEESPSRFHSKVIRVPSLWVLKYPVT
jgi:hypothetical protein